MVLLLLIYTYITVHIRVKYAKNLKNNFGYFCPIGEILHSSMLMKISFSKFKPTFRGSTSPYQALAFPSRGSFVSRCSQSTDINEMTLFPGSVFIDPGFGRTLHRGHTVNRPALLVISRDWSEYPKVMFSHALLQSLLAYVPTCLCHSLGNV